MIQSSIVEIEPGAINAVVKGFRWAWGEVVTLFGVFPPWVLPMAMIVLVVLYVWRRRKR